MSFGTFKRAFGLITVHESNDVISVEGINPKIMAKDINAVWLTSRISKHMFLGMTDSGFTIPHFFALDIYFIINKMINDAGPDVDIRSPIRTLSKIKEALLENTWLRCLSEPWHNRLDYSRLNNMNTTLMDHQKELLDDYAQATAQYDLNGFLFAAAPGTGKTIASVALNETLNNDVCIIVAPQVSLQEVWEDTLKKRFKQTPTFWSSNVGGAEFTGNEKYLITHYEYLEKLILQLSKLKNKKVMLILDESHNFNNWDTLRSSLFKELMVKLRVRDSIWLSGTPIKAMAGEAITIIDCIDPRFTPIAKEKFSLIYRGSTGAALDILQNRINIFSKFVSKEVINLEPPIFKDVFIKIPGGHKYTLPEIYKEMVKYTKERLKYYEDIRNECEEYFYKILSAHKKTLFKSADTERFKQYETSLKVVIDNQSNQLFKDDAKICSSYENTYIVPQLSPEDKVQFKHVRSIVKCLKLKVQGECLGRVVGKMRVDCHYDLAKYIDYVGITESSPKKTVVFTSYVDVLLSAEEKCHALNLYPVTVYGANSKDIASTVSKFTNEERYNPLIATYKTLSTAVPLPAADKMIMIDAPFRDYHLQQAVSRIHRKSDYEKTQVYVYMCQLDTGEVTNISTRNFDILKWSQEQVENITGVKSPFDLNIEHDGEDAEHTHLVNSIIGDNYISDIFDNLNPLTAFFKKK